MDQTHRRHGNITIIIENDDIADTIVISGKIKFRDCSVQFEDKFVPFSARTCNGHLLSLDRRLMRVAGQLNLPLIEVDP